ncbi:5876_t:CDS:2, partial [Racocetra persica]
PILMRLEYQVKLPDHDWIVAKKHKLIPSVYAILDVKEGKYRHAEAVTYSDSIFIRIHSGKHDSSTVYSHNKDFDNLIVKEKLYNYTTTDDLPKPVVEDTIIDGYLVLAKYVDPSEEFYYPDEKLILLNRFFSPPLMIQQKTHGDFEISYLRMSIHQRGEFLVSNDNYETIWVDEEIIPKDVSETYYQQ